MLSKTTKPFDIKFSHSIALQFCPSDLLGIGDNPSLGVECGMSQLNVLHHPTTQ